MTQELPLRYLSGRALSTKQITHQILYYFCFLIFISLLHIRNSQFASVAHRYYASQLCIHSHLSVYLLPGFGSCSIFCRRGCVEDSGQTSRLKFCSLSMAPCSRLDEENDCLLFGRKRSICCLYSALSSAQGINDGLKASITIVTTIITTSGSIIELAQLTAITARIVKVCLLFPQALPSVISTMIVLHQT